MSMARTIARAYAFTALVAMLVLVLGWCPRGTRGVEATSRNAYATIHYEGTPKDAGTAHTFSFAFFRIKNSKQNEMNIALSSFLFLSFLFLFFEQGYLIFMGGYCAEYLLAIRVMMRSLRRSGTTADIVVLVSPNVREETRQVLRNDGALVMEVPNLVNPYKAHAGETQRYLARFEFTLNKLYMWNLTQYERVVYLDADNIALGNLDELFNCGHFCVVFMNPCNFHTGLLVIKPDTKQFNVMVQALYNRTRSYDGADQGFLTAFFPFKVLDRWDFWVILSSVLKYDYSKWEVPQCLILRSLRKMRHC